MLLHNHESYQVSPDLYGDNNTRFFTYWTVSSSCLVFNCIEFEAPTVLLTWSIIVLVLHSFTCILFNNEFNNANVQCITRTIMINETDY